MAKTICQSLTGAVISISSVPLPRSSANSRIVKSGGTNRNTSQNTGNVSPSLPSPRMAPIGYSTPRGPTSVRLLTVCQYRSPVPIRKTVRTT